MFANVRTRMALGILTALIPAAAGAATPIFGGDFEDGTLAGWTAAGTLGGFGGVVTEGGCFSSNDTTGIVLSGNHAGLVRSNKTGDLGSSGTLTSAPFEAGIGVAFSALTERIDGDSVPTMPVDFTARILGADGAVLKEVGLTTAVVELVDGCFKYPVNGAFSSHYIDTRAFTGQQVRVQFAQSSRVPHAGFFTLLDDVVRLDADDSQVLPDRPRAVAGFSQSADGRLRLDGSLSGDPAGVELVQYWTVDGETYPREGVYPCIDDLEPGRYHATLVVSNGAYMDVDDLRFVILPEPLVADEGGPLPTDGEPVYLEADVPLNFDCSDSPEAGAETPAEDGTGTGTGEDAGASG